jgi:hypothetical protein
MKSNLLVELGYTPLIDPIIDEVGLIGAAVYGIVFRFCQMRDGMCYASHSRLAKNIGVSQRTVIRYLNRLVELGYLKIGATSMRPEGYAPTNVYFCTSKIESKIPTIELDDEKLTPIPNNDFIDPPLEL